MLKFLKNIKNNGTSNTFHRPLYVMLTKVMRIYITLIQGCIEIMSQHPIK